MQSDGIASNKDIGPGSYRQYIGPFLCGSRKYTLKRNVSISCGDSANELIRTRTEMTWELATGNQIK